MTEDPMFRHQGRLRENVNNYMIEKIVSDAAKRVVNSIMPLWRYTVPKDITSRLVQRLFDVVQLAHPELEHQQILYSPEFRAFIAHVERNPHGLLPEEIFKDDDIRKQLIDSAEHEELMRNLGLRRY